MSAAQRKQKLEVQVVKNVRLEYLLSLPKGYRASKEQFPLMLFLHGSGERGSDLEKVKLHGLPKMLEAGLELPCIVVHNVPKNHNGMPKRSELCLITSSKHCALTQTEFM
jgi:predicted peptidase